MSEWLNVAKADDIEPGKWLTAEIGNTFVAVFNLNGEYFAIEDVCTHDGGDLASGWLEGEEIVCPRHGARFCVKTGEVRSPPAYEDVQVFPVRVEDGTVQVKREK
ncbi:MAG: non-heme iron oxygenase ferredoxin subunit [Burkholderiales bacterium]